MRRHNALLSAVFVLGLAAAAAAPAAATTVLVVDSKKVLEDSTVGKYITEKMNAIGDQIKGELKPEQDAVKADYDKFTADTAGKTDEQVAADKGLTERRNALQNKLAQLQVSEQVKQREFVATSNAAIEPVRTTLQNLLDETVKEQKGDLLIEKGAFLYVADSADITQKVIDKLNAKLTQVPVERVRLPTTDDSKGAAAPAAAAPAAGAAKPKPKTN
jgi:outer membrane protein